jgi:hypothetical protein
LNKYDLIRTSWIIKGILLTCLALGLTACNEKEPDSVLLTSPPLNYETEIIASGKNTPPPAETDADVSIEFLPAEPTVESDIWALLKGSTAASWAWKKNGFEVAGAAGDHLLRSNFRKGDEITVIVDTGKGLYDATVTIGNAPPRIATVSLQNTDLQKGSGITAHPEGVDADGDPVTFNFVWALNGVEHPEMDSSSLPREIFHEGDRISLKVTPFDGENSGRPFISEEIVIPNAPPFFTSAPPVKFINYHYTYQIQGTDPDGDAVIYSLEEGPPDMKFDAATGLLTWKVPVNAAGDHRIRIAAEDKRGAKAVQEFDLRTMPATDL